MHLLHLEDSPTDAELIALLIRREWPACEIKHVATVTEYRDALATGGFDLILSDYSLPGFDGLSALSMARAHFPETPFLFLSGTIGEERAVAKNDTGGAEATAFTAAAHAGVPGSGSSSQRPPPAFSSSFQLVPVAVSVRIRTGEPGRSGVTT